MNDKTLKEMLRTLPVPEPDGGTQKRALHRATLALASARNVPALPEPWSVWRYLGAGLCGVVMVAGLGWLFRPTTALDPPLAAEGRILSQMEILFPGQLEAVIEADGGMDLKLAAEPVAPSGQPLIVSLVRNGRVVRVLSYSGRRVCLEIGGTATCFEAFLTGDGAVIVTGENFFWSKQQPASLAGYQIGASALQPPS